MKYDCVCINLTIQPFAPVKMQQDLPGTDIQRAQNKTEVACSSLQVQCCSSYSSITQASVSHPFPYWELVEMHSQDSFAWFTCCRRLTSYLQDTVMQRPFYSWTVLVEIHIS